MSGELFIVSQNEKSLSLFGAYLFELLSIKFTEIRYSENVWGGSYLTGTALGLRLTLELADLKDFEDYDFLLSFGALVRTEFNKTYSFDELADTIAPFLASNGMKVARPLDLARRGTPIVTYAPT